MLAACHCICSSELVLQYKAVKAASTYQTCGYSGATRPRGASRRACGSVVRLPGCLSSRPRLGSCHRTHAFWSRKRRQQAETPSGVEGAEDEGIDMAAGEPAPVIIELVSKEGDTLYSLARDTGLDYDRLLAANGGSTVLEPRATLRFQMQLPDNVEELVEVIRGGGYASAAADLAEEEEEIRGEEEPAAEHSVGVSSSAEVIGQPDGAGSLGSEEPREADRVVGGEVGVCGMAADGVGATGAARAQEIQAGAAERRVALGRFQVVEHDTPGRVVRSTFRYLSPFMAAGLLGLVLWAFLKGPRISDADKDSLAERARRRREALMAAARKPETGDGREGRGDARSATSDEAASGSFSKHLAAKGGADSKRLSEARRGVRVSEGLGVGGSLERESLYASLGEASSSGNGAGIPSTAGKLGEPTWLRLPKVYYLLLPGNQSPSFRLQPQLPDDYSWIAWEAEEDARQLLAWFLERGEVSPGDSVAAAKPYDFMRLAALNERSVSFVAKGSLQLSPDISDDDLWVDLLSAATSLPLRPLQEGITSVQALLHQHDGQPPESSQVHHHAWEVHVPTVLPQSAPDSPAQASSNGNAQRADEHDASALSSEAFDTTTANGSSPSGSRGSSSQNGVSAQQGKREESGSASSSQNKSSISQQGKQEALGDDGQAGEDMSDKERVSEYAAMMRGMKRVRKTAESMGYVPKIAQQFSQQFASQEQALKQAASADPNFNPFQAANQSFEAEFSDSSQPHPRNNAPSQGIPGTSASGFSQNGGGASPGTSGSDAEAGADSEVEEDKEYAGLEEWADLATRAFGPSGPPQQAPGSRLPSTADNGRQGPTREGDTARREADAQTRLQEAFAASEQQAGSIGEEAYLAESARVIDLSEQPGKVQMAEFTDSNQGRGSPASAAEQAEGIYARRKPGGGGGGNGIRVINGRDEVLQKLRTDWWKMLPALWLPVVEDGEGGEAFVLVDMSSNSKKLVDKHVVGFACRADAQKFAWLYSSYDMGSCRVEVLSPEGLDPEIGGQEIGITIFKEGLLPLEPGLPYEELPYLLAAYAHEAA